MTVDRLPPYDEQAEAGALGCILLANGTAGELLDKLTPDDFYDVRHQILFDALRQQQHDAQPIDAATVAIRLREKGLLENAGGLEYVATLPDKTPSAANFDFYLQTLQDRATRRALLRDAAELTGLAENLALPRATLANAAQRMAEAYAAGRAKAKLTLRRPGEFLEMTFDDSDRLLGDRLWAKGQSVVIAAPGGTGKSRLLLQWAAAMISRREFIGFTTGGADLKWLILQTENSNRRMQADLRHVRAWLGNAWADFEARVTIHAIENDADAFVSLDNPENIANIAAAIAETKPDVVAIDPLNEFGIGDLNKDVDMKATLQALSRVCRKGNPERGIVVAHHAITGKAGAAKATGFDRASYARNSKALHAWARGQINIAPADAESNDRLIVACGKCSNGKEFEAFGIRLNTETMIYECDPSIDVSQWQQEMTGAKAPLMSPERVQELCSGPMTKGELAKAITEDCGCYRTGSYRYIKAAERARKIQFSKTHETYTRK